jgi:hypothetical protein
MAYTPFHADWLDFPDETTPVTAEALEHIEDGIDDAHTLIDDHIADTTAAHAASAIGVTPAGNLAADDVQEGLQELQGDINSLDTRVDTLEAAAWKIFFTAPANEPPASSYATLDTRNSHPVLDFDAAADERAVFRAVLPSVYSGGGLNVKLIWAATSATAGNVIWRVVIERLNAGAVDLDADSWGPNVNGSAAATDSVSGETTETTIAVSDGANMDSLAAGEMFRLNITRVGTDGSDTMTGDAELLMVVVTEQ